MKQVQLTLFLIINSLFVLKYSIRFTSYCLLYTFSYIIFALIIYWVLTTKQDLIPSIKLKKWIYIILCLLGVMGIIVLLRTINPYSVQVDRWSAIDFFLKRLFSGEYPYAAQTHLGQYASPFPAWLCFHIPFYLFGDVGLGMLFSFVLMAFWAVWFFEVYDKALLFLVLLLISPAFWYEVAVRSDLFYNLLLCFLMIGVLYKKKITIQSNVWTVGIICGLFLSTRITTMIPLFLYLFPGFLMARNKIKILFVTTVLSVFVLTLMPFVFWDFHTLFFFQHNPFILQTRQGSVLEIVFLIPLILFMALKWNSLRTFMSYSAISLFLLVAISILYRMINDHFVAGLFDSAYDITYFNMSLPFIFAALTLTQTDDVR